MNIKKVSLALDVLVRKIKFDVGKPICSLQKKKSYCMYINFFESLVFKNVSNPFKYFFL